MDIGYQRMLMSKKRMKLVVTAEDTVFSYLHLPHFNPIVLPLPPDMFEDIISGLRLFTETNDLDTPFPSKEHPSRYDSTFHNFHDIRSERRSCSLYRDALCVKDAVLGYL